MSWKNIRLIFLRELRDQLRDRRTLFMVAILPMLLYPALGIGMVEMTVTFAEQVRNVVILGADDLHAGQPGTLPPLLVGNQFLPYLFADPADSFKLHVVTDAPGDNVEMSLEDLARVAAAQSQLDTIHALAELVRQRRVLETRLTALSLARVSGLQIFVPDDELPDDPEIDRVEHDTDQTTSGIPEQPSASVEVPARPADVVEEAGSPALDELDPQLMEQEIRRLMEAEARLKSGLTTWFRNSDIQVLVVIPEGFSESISEQTQSLIQRTPSESRAMLRPVVLQNSADEKSQIAYRRVREAIDNWEHLILQSQLSAAGLPASIDKPVDATRVDLAQGEQLAANLWSKLFPTMLVIMAVTGAFYPAIDLGAGEKERGTMETLLICPATRTEIVMGKFLTVTCFSISSALLNLLCMGLTGKHMISQSVGSGPAGAMLGDVSFPPLSSLVWLLVLAVPLSALFSSLSLGFAMFARSSKEGQYYLTPLLLVTMGLTFFCLYPGVEIDPFKSILPVVGPSLLLKSLLLQTGKTTEILVYAIPVLLSSVAYCAIALWWAVELFSKEDVLFREAERFDLRLWLAHVFRDKEPTPSFTEAAFCIVLILLLQFAAIPFLQSAMLEALQAQNAAFEILQLQTIYLIATVGTPALMMGLLLTSRVDWTLKLKAPSLSMWIAAAVLPFTLQPISIELVHRLDWFFPKLPEGVAQFVAAIADTEISFWWPLLAVAIAPAICEELAFRGFILSGLQRSGRHWLAIVISGLTFGLIHLIPQQQFNGALLGIVLGLLAVRSGSLWPGVLFHFLYNGMQVVQTRVSEETFQSGLFPVLFRVEEAGLRAQWPFLMVCIVISTAVIIWLVRHPSAEVRPE